MPPLHPCAPRISSRHDDPASGYSRQPSHPDDSVYLSLSLLALTSIDNPRPRLFYSIYLATLCARITHDHGNPRTPTILSISLGPRISTSRQPSRPAILSIYLAALRPASHDLCARISHGPRLSRHHGNPRAPTILSRPSPLSTSRLLQAPSRLSLFRASSPPSTSYRPPILSIVHLSIYRPTSLSLSLPLALSRAPLSLSSFFFPLPSLSLSSSMGHKGSYSLIPPANST